MQGFGSVRYGHDYSLGVKGWGFQFHKADDTTLSQKHVHIYGPKKDYSQNEDGSPHHKDQPPGGPPNSMKKELKKQTGWDWDKNAKAYEKRQKEIQRLIQDASMFYPEGIPEEIFYLIVESVYLGNPTLPRVRVPRIPSMRPQFIP